MKILAKLLRSFALWILRVQGYRGAFNVSIEALAEELSNMESVHLHKCVVNVNMGELSSVSDCFFDDCFVEIMGVRTLTNSMFNACLSGNSTITMVKGELPLEAKEDLNLGTTP